MLFEALDFERGLIRWPGFPFILVFVVFGVFEGTFGGRGIHHWREEPGRVFVFGSRQTAAVT